MSDVARISSLNFSPNQVTCQFLHISQLITANKLTEVCFLLFFRDERFALSWGAAVKRRKLKHLTLLVIFHLHLSVFDPLFTRAFSYQSFVERFLCLQRFEIFRNTHQAETDWINLVFFFFIGSRAVLSPCSQRSCALCLIFCHSAANIEWDGRNSLSVKVLVMKR